MHATRRILPLVAGFVMTLSAPRSLQGAALQLADSGARMERLAEGVYAIIHEDATTDWPAGSTNWPHGNTGVIVGDDGVLVVDATYYPSRARADIALIRRLTPKPVRYLVNTHWHGDHTHGNGEYRDAFPAITIVGARGNDRFIALNQARWPKVATAVNSPTRQALTGYESILTAGKDSTGRDLSAAELAALKLVVQQHRTELVELAAVQVAPPTLLFDRELSLSLGRRRIVLHDWDRANSPHDVTVYLPDERVLFTGDIVVHPIPYAFSAWPTPWIEVLRQLEAIPVTALVPGHGPVFHDQAFTRQVRTLLETVRDRVAVLLGEGATVDQVKQRIPLDDLREAFVRGDPHAGEYWDDSIARALVESTIQCVTGYRC